MLNPYLILYLSRTLPKIFQMQKFGGISRYFTELILNTDYTKIDYKISLLFNSNEYLRNKALKKFTSHFTIKYNKKYYIYINFINKYFSNITNGVTIVPISISVDSKFCNFLQIVFGIIELLFVVNKM